MSSQNKITPNFEETETISIEENEISRGNNHHVIEINANGINDASELNINQEVTQVNGDTGNNRSVDNNTNISKTVIFNNIINGLEEYEESLWMKKLNEKIYSQYKRMPNGWWPKIKDAFNLKFNKNLSLVEVKSCYTREKNKTNSSQRRVNIVSNDIKNAELFQKVQDTLQANINKYCVKNEVKHITKKIYSQNINNEVIDMINNIVRNENLGHKVDTIKDYNNFIYACQVTYEKVLEKPKVNSTWKESIEAKIKKLTHKLEILNNHELRAPTSKQMMKVCKEANIHSNDNEKVMKLKDEIFEQISVFKKKIKISEKRIKFRRENSKFEFNRQNFYRDLESEKFKINPDISKEETRKYWAELWSKDENSGNFKELTDMLDPIRYEIDITDEKIRDIVVNNLRFLSNWKTPGHDHVYNFFIKKIEVLHEKLIELVIDVIKNPEHLDEEFYIGNTFLIPKKEDTKEAKDTRPITCLPNIYKLISKCITKLITEICDINNILSKNQMGTINRCQGAKEQAIINKNLNDKYNNELFTSWIDIQKAYDSVNHMYLLECLNKLKFPPNILNFIKRSLQLQKTNLICNKQEMGIIQIKSGIIQGDSLSPKLFVIAMEPLSRILNENCEQLKLKDCSDFERNHLIFVDDIKLLARDKEMLIELCTFTKICLNKMGFQVNETKSSSNVESECVFGEMLKDEMGYKYLGVLEDSKNVVKEANKEIIKKKIVDRLEKLCQTNLNSKNMFHSFNEFAISTLNYYIGLIPFEPKDYEGIDKEIRKIVLKYKIIKKSSNNDRLYLTRDNLGRGLHNVEERSENILFNLYEHLKKSNERNVILEIERKNNSHLGLIKEYLITKYNLNEDNLDIKEIKKKQHLKRMEKIHMKKLHSVLFENEEGKIDVKQSSSWLKNGNVTPQEEGILCALQDRNLFYKKQKCQHCNKGIKTVDHLATHCGRMLDHDYKKRHNDVVRSIHFWFARKYGFNKNKKLKNYRVESVLSNSRVRIKTDITIETELRLEHNKPDILIHDLMKNEITIIEVGITNKRILTNVEITKGRKYELLGKELGMMYQAKVSLVPIVITWDGCVTKYFKKYMESLNLGKRVQAYIQNLVLKRTCESVLIDYRNQNSDGELEELQSVFERAENARLNVECGASESLSEEDNLLS